MKHKLSNHYQQYSSVNEALYLMKENQIATALNSPEDFERYITNCAVKSFEAWEARTDVTDIKGGVKVQSQKSFKDYRKGELHRNPLDIEREGLPEYTWMDEFISCLNSGGNYEITDAYHFTRKKSGKHTRTVVSKSGIVNSSQKYDFFFTFGRPDLDMIKTHEAQLHDLRGKTYVEIRFYRDLYRNYKGWRRV